MKLSFPDTGCEQRTPGPMCRTYNHLLLWGFAGNTTVVKWWPCKDDWFCVFDDAPEL